MLDNNNFYLQKNKKYQNSWTVKISLNMSGLFLSQIPNCLK